ncbi:restriction endonuclease subunit S [Vibrio rumoiensis]|uniref:Restriction endonuclease subunit S n=1 Tax=Vibrio rumoiensis TaxID=76258 RepID=A0ABW7J045_9VIBR
MSNVVPEGWKRDKLSNICHIVGGGTPDRSERQYWNGTIPWISPTEVTKLKSRYISNSKEMITNLGLEKSSAKLHPIGTVLMTSRASIGYVAINNIPVTTNQGFQSLQCKQDIYNEYLYQHITWIRPELEKLSAGSTFSEISSTTLKSVNLTFPPLPEQKKIAAILTSVDEVIEKTQAQIDKLKDLKTAMMQELLTCGVGVDGKPHTEFKDSPVGRIPKGWEVKVLEELVKLDRKITYGIVQAGPHYEGGVPYIRVSDMNNRELSANGMLLTSPEIAKKYDRSSVQTGDIVYALRGMIGHVHIVPESLNGANLTQGTARLSINDEINTNYLLWAMRSPYVALQNDLEAKGSTFKEVTLASLRKISVAIPSITEQEDISLILSAIERKQYFVEDKIIQLKSLKKALMQDLLTGKVRVKVD